MGDFELRIHRPVDGAPRLDEALGLFRPDFETELRRIDQRQRLADLLARQRRLQRQLDLDQDSAGASRMDTEDTKLAA